jgi:hypothetical protein
VHTVAWSGAIPVSVARLARLARQASNLETSA